MREINKDSTVRQRVMQLCDYFGISPNKLSADVGYNRNYISRMTDSMSYDFLIHIYRNYDTINIEWLLTGNGRMLLPDTDEQQSLKQVLDMLNTALKRNENLENELKDLRIKLNNVADIAMPKNV